jgi:4-aminobutyrate aminotransferase-like enzyme
MPRAPDRMANRFDPATADRLQPRLRGLVERRAAVLGPGYRLFYERPVEIVRGAGVHLYDADGVEYLDAYNNVPCVGHAHPRVVDAIARQAATLNTHTRYAAEPILDYAERLLATHAPELRNVTFTCTGSEANDLALRVARFQTGADGVIVTANAYHGVTAAVAEMSPSLGPNVPLGTHVRAVAPPDPSLGDAAAVGAAFAAGVAQAIADLERHGARLAAFVVDSIFSTDGILPDPAGFLAPAVDVVRAAGGLYVADEVQSGFGRTGDALWGYLRHGLSPDLVTLGKPMANGLPVAALVARPEAIEAFGTSVRYFNTFGGNAVSIAAAAAVLDVIEDEGLVANARVVGRALRDGIRMLAADHAVLGDVRGAGLYVGADLVDPATGAPAPALATRIVNGLRERRVLISASGPHAATLKIRPPLPFAAADAGRFLDALADTLTEVAQ